MKINKRSLALCIAVPLAVGGLSSLLSAQRMKLFESLSKPPLSPPGWLFPIVWTLLYIMMGFTSYLVLLSCKPRAVTDRALWLYALQLALNFFWPILFFVLSAYLFAFVELVAMWLLIILTAAAFYRIDKTAGYLMIPYLVWVTFAGYLNLGIYLMN